MDNTITPSNTCFVIAPIDKEGTDIRKRSDQVFKHVIEPAANTCGLTALRADQISAPGAITTQVINHIIHDAVLVADLTGRNPNVFYELAVRHAFRKPYAQLIEKGEQLPFDVIGLRTIDVDLHDPDMVVTAKEELQRQIGACLDGALVDNPISNATQMDALLTSANQQDQQLAEVLAGIAATRADVSALRAREGTVDEILRILRSTCSAYPGDALFRMAREVAEETGIRVEGVSKSGRFLPGADEPFEVTVRSQDGKEYPLRPATDLTPSGTKETMRKDLRKLLTRG